MGKGESRIEISSPLVEAQDRASWNRREEQAADSLKRINHANGWFFLFCLAVSVGWSRGSVISSASEKSFSLTVKRCMRTNENGKPVSPRISDAVFHARGIEQRIVKAARAKILRRTSDDDTRRGIASHGEKQPSGGGAG